MEELNIPLYRAKKIESDEYVIGHFLPEYYLIEDESGDIDIGKSRKLFNVIKRYGSMYEIDTNTLAIHFKNMIDTETKEPLFASLNEKGGDIVQGECRDINGDTLIGFHKPLSFIGELRYYNETTQNIVIVTDTEIVASTKDWSRPLILKQGEAMRWSDCRQDIKAIGIKE